MRPSAGDRVANPDSGDRPVSGAVVGAPAAGMMGSNVRDVARPVPVSDETLVPVSTTSSNTGGYQYRY